MPFSTVSAKVSTRVRAEPKNETQNAEYESALDLVAPSRQNGPIFELCKERKFKLPMPCCEAEREHHRAGSSSGADLDCRGMTIRP